MSNISPIQTIYILKLKWIILNNYSMTLKIGLMLTSAPVPQKYAFLDDK